MLTPQQKEDLRNLIRNAVDPNGMKIAKLPGMLSELGIDWHEHQLAGEKFLVWLQRMLPEIKVDGYYVTLSPTAATPVVPEYICRQIIEFVQNTPNCKVFMVQRRLEQLNIRFTDYPAGEATYHFPTWLRNIPGIAVNGFFVSIANTESVPETDPDAKAEIDSMGKEVWLETWDKLYIKMQCLTGRDLKVGWKALIAHSYQMACTMQCQPYWYETAAKDDLPARHVFRLNDVLDTEGRQLYFVLENVEKLHRPWSLLEIVYPGQVGTQCGPWLCRAFGIRSEETSTMRISEEAQEMVNHLHDVLEAHSAAAQRLANAVMVGLPLDDQDLQSLQDYHQFRNNLEELLSQIAGADLAGQPLKRIDDYYSGTSFLRITFNHLLERMSMIHSSLRSVLEECRILSEKTEEVFAQDATEMESCRTCPAGSLGWNQYDGLTAMAQRYDLLICLSGFKEASAETDPLIDQAHELFSISPRHITWMIMANERILELQPTMREVQAELLALRGALDGSASEEALALPKKQFAFSQERLLTLLQRILSDDESARPSRKEINDHFPALNKLEEQIVFADFEAARAIAGDAALMAQIGYSEQAIHAIQEQLDDEHAKAFNRSAAPLACGSRLYGIQGNENRQAERFYLTDLPSAESFSALLNLYRGEGQQQMFVYLMEHLQGEATRDDWNVLVAYYAQVGDAESLTRLLTAKPELLHQGSGETRNIELLTPDCAPKGEFWASVLQTVRSTVGLAAEIPLSSAAKAILSGETDTLRQTLITAPDSLELSLDEASHWLRDLSDDSKTDVFSIALRLNRLLDDKFSCVAEQMMWDALHPAQLRYQMGECLLPLLGKQQRYDEIILLYRANESVLKTIKNCRILYLKAMCSGFTGYGDSISQFARTYLVDALQQFQLLKNTKLSMTDPELTDILQMLDDACHMSEYVGAVINDSSALEGYILQPDHLMQLNFTSQQIVQVTSQYKSGTYTREQDAYAVASRVYAFLRNNFGLAERLARFAVPLNQQAGENKPAMLLLNILVQENRWTEARGLFEEVPLLEQKKPAVWLQTVIRCGLFDEYEEVPEETKAQLEPAYRQSVEDLIALYQEDMTQEQALAAMRFSPDHVADALSQFAPLMGTFCAQDWDQAIVLYAQQTILPMLEKLSAKDIEQLVTGDGALSDEDLSHLQTLLLGNPDTEALPIYMSRVLHICHEGSIGNDFFDRMLVRLSEPGVYVLLSTLYPDRADFIQSQRCVNELQAKLSNEFGAGDIHDYLFENQRVIQDWSSVMDMLTEAGLSLRDMLEDVLHVIQPTEAQLRAFRAIWQPDDEVAVLTVAEAGLLFGLLDKHALADEELPQLQALCERTMRGKRTMQTAICLYLIYHQQQYEDLADVALVHVLTYYAKEPIPAALLKNPLSREDVADACPLLKLFRKAVMSVPLEQVTETATAHLARFQGLFLPPSNADHDWLENNFRNDVNEMPASDAAGERLLRILYWVPTEKNAWRILPILNSTEYDGLNLRLMMICAEKVNRDFAWKNLVHTLLNRGEEHLLPMALIRQLKLVSGGMHIGAQKMVVSCLNTLAALPESQQQDVRDLVRELCQSLRHDDTLHVALVNLADIAITLHCNDIVLESDTARAALRSEKGSNALVAYAYRLLLEKDLDRASELLREALGLGGMIANLPLCRELASMDQEALAQWVEYESNRMLLNILLPNINRPTYEELMSRLVLPTIAKADASSSQRAANVLMRLMDMYSPNRITADNAQCLALYLLVKSSPLFPGAEVCMQRAMYLLNITAGTFNFRSGRYRDDTNDPNSDHMINQRWQQNDLILANWLVQQNYPDRSECNVDDLLVSRSPANQSELAERTRMIRQLLADMPVADAHEAVWAKLTGNWTEIMLRCFRDSTALGNGYLALMKLEPGTKYPAGLFLSFVRAYAKMDNQGDRERYCGWLGNVAHRGFTPGQPLIPAVSQVFANAATFLRKYYIEPEVNIQADADLLSMPLDEISQADKLTAPALNAPSRLDKVRRLILVGLVLNDARTLYYNTASASFADAACRLMAIERLIKDFHILYPVPALGLIKQVVGTQLAARATFFRAMDDDDKAFVVTLGRAANVLLDWICNPAFYCDNKLSMEERIQNLAKVIVRLSEQEESYANYLVHLYDLLYQQKQRDANRSMLDAMVRQRQNPAERFIDYTVLKQTQSGEAGIYFKAQSDALLGTCNDFIAVRREFKVPVSTDVLKSFLEAAQVAQGLSTMSDSADVPQAEDDQPSWTEPAFIQKLRSEQGMLDDGKLMDEQSIAEDYAHWCDAEKTADPSERARILERRRQLSCLMYGYAAQKHGTAQIQEACLRLCYDHWACLNQTLANDAALRSERVAPVLMEMSLLAMQCSKDFEACQWYQDKMIAAFYDLISGIQDLDMLLSLFGGHINTLRKLAEWVNEPDPIWNDAPWSNNPANLSLLFTDLEKLCGICRTYNDNDHQLAENLSAVMESFHVISYDQNRACHSMQLYVKNLIAMQLNKMYDRPNLQIRLLNKDHQVSDKDSLFGIVYNHGKQPACNVVLRALAQNGVDLSMTARLNVLRPGSSAPFELSFTLPSHVKQLQVVLTAEYEFDGAIDRSTLSESQTLDVRLRPRVSLPAIPYPTETIDDFSLDENHEIVSDMLVGREFEKKALRALATGSFSQYRNAFVRGVRRSGKSSLLNYLHCYIENCQEDSSIHPIFVSLQNVSTRQIIQFAFVSRVIAAMKTACPQIAFKDEWSKFEKSWELPPEAEDRSLDELSSFYAQLSFLADGHRMVLILDEFDKILERDASEQPAQVQFFKQLDAILTDVELRKYVRFVFCGSNYLLRCSMDGGIMHQVFQRADTIEVGHLSEADMRTMLLKPTQEAGSTFYFTEEALSYCYQIFQGSIWPVRLIGQKIVDELRKIDRSVVYPSDICKYASYVLDPNDKCQQFTEGCEQNERRVLRAMHYYTTHRSASVSVAELQERLQVNGERLDPNSLGISLSLLRQLKLVEEDNMSTLGKRYRFAGELYRIFFSILFDKEHENDALPYDDTIFLLDAAESLTMQDNSELGQFAAFSGMQPVGDGDDE